MTKGGSVLIIEDTLSLALLYERQLTMAGFKVTVSQTGTEGLAVFEKERPDILLLDLGLPDMDGTEILENIGPEQTQTAVVVITADGSIDKAVTAMRLGARDFLVKPFSESRLLTTVKNLADTQSLARTVARIEKTLPKSSFGGFVGSSPAMRAVYAAIENVAGSKATIFVTGESGTGKEVTAEAIHHASKPKSAPFIALNCGAIPHDLIESELFGHKKGSFTGAISDRLGAARAANGGTLFLDEICEMRPDLQTKLLRFLQTMTVTPVGSEKAEPVDVRVICATNRDPLEEVRVGRFREDLYYRLNVIPIELPPLRDRGQDILEIAAHFLTKFAVEEGKTFEGFSPDASAKLMAWSWPGNVRELQNTVRQIAVMAPDGLVEVDQIPTRSGSNAVGEGMGGETGGVSPVTGAPETVVPADNPSNFMTGTLADLEREIIEARIETHNGSLPKAAASLGLSPSTLYRKRESWEG